jgi:hypothetical protein
LAIVCTPDETRCPGCGRGMILATHDQPALRVMSIERKAGKFASSGSILMSTCPVCGQAVREIEGVVPIELDGLVCACGSKEFNFPIRSLKRNKEQTATEWDSDLGITCLSCSKPRLVERILGFLSVKRIKVGATGVDLEMFHEPHKSYRPCENSGP